jgi:hypothetical protein
MFFWKSASGKVPRRNLFSGLALAAALLTAVLAALPEPPALARSKGAAPAQAAKAGPVGHVIIISVDGLLPESYLAPDKYGLQVPTLRELAAQGAISTGTRSVLPSVTYPAHTSIATGCNPGRHGITDNRAWDPLERNQAGWRWYAEDVRVPTLWQAARARGLKTALVSWPVTMGARADFLVPEFWRAGTSEDKKLVRAIATPGLLDEVAREYPDFWDRWTPPSVRDSAITDVAVHILLRHRPQLTMIHIFDVDHFQHGNGPWSREAIAAIEAADAQIARLIAAAKLSGMWSRTALVLASDHGFRSYSRRIRPGVRLREAGLVTLDERNRIQDWKAVIASATGSAFLYVKDRNDAETRRRLEEIFSPLAGAPSSGIARVLSRQQIIEMGGDPEAVLALEPAPGFALSGGYVETSTEERSVAGHGWPPDRPDMLASTIFYGPMIEPGRIEGARLIDIAPTVAPWLGLKMDRAEGQPLPVRLRAARPPR